MKTNTHPKYLQLRADAASMNEREDCTVRALAVVADVPYVRAHEIMARAGRHPRRGTWILRVNPDDVLKAVDMRVEKDYFQMQLRVLHRGPVPTPRTIGRMFPVGRYLVFTRGHVFGMVHGQIIDWAAGRRHRIQYVLKVTSRIPQ